MVQTGAHTIYAVWVEEILWVFLYPPTRSPRPPLLLGLNLRVMHYCLLCTTIKNSACLTSRRTCGSITPVIDIHNFLIRWRPHGLRGGVECHRIWKFVPNPLFPHCCENRERDDYDVCFPAHVCQEFLLLLREQHFYLVERHSLNFANLPELARQIELRRKRRVLWLRSGSVRKTEPVAGGERNNRRAGNQCVLLHTSPNKWRKLHPTNDVLVCKCTSSTYILTELLSKFRYENNLENIVKIKK